MRSPTVSDSYSDLLIYPGPWHPEGLLGPRHLDNTETYRRTGGHCCLAGHIEAGADRATAVARLIAGPFRLIPAGGGLTHVKQGRKVVLYIESQPPSRLQSADRCARL